MGDTSYQEVNGTSVKGPVIARSGPSWSNWVIIRPNTNINPGDVFAFGGSKIIEWTNYEGTNFMFRYGVPLLNFNSNVLGDSPAMALFETQQAARAFAQYQETNSTAVGGPYVTYVFSQDSGDRDTDGAISTVVGGTVLDLVDDEIATAESFVELVGQMDDRRSTSIYSSPGELTKYSSQSFFNESFDDLKTIARRYQFYSDFDTTLLSDTCFGKVIARIPIRPIIFPDITSDTCAGKLFNAVRGGFIANIGSGYRFFKGSLRFKIIFTTHTIDETAKQDDEDLVLMITHVPDRGADRNIAQPSELLPTSYNPQGYAYYGHSTKINPICEIEVPYYSRYEYITPQYITSQNDLDNLGYLDISLAGRINKSVQLAMQVYYSFGDDARFSSFQGFPSMVYLGDIPQDPQQATQASVLASRTLQGQMFGIDEKIGKVIADQGQDFTNNLMTALNTSAESACRSASTLIGDSTTLIDNTIDRHQQTFFENGEKLIDRIDDTMAKREGSFFEGLEEATDYAADKFQATAKTIVDDSLKQCLQFAEQMGMTMETVGNLWIERFVNIVTSVGHIIVNPTIKTAFLSLVQILLNLGLIMASKVSSLFSSFIGLFQKNQVLDGQAEGMEAMVSTFATSLLTAAGITLGRSKSRSIQYATSGLRLFKDFSLASNSFHTWIKNNLTWISDFLRWAHISTSRLELDDAIANQYSEMKEWISETHRIIQIPIHRIEADPAIILKTYTLAWKAEAFLTMECADAKKLPIHHSIRYLSTEICKVRDQLLSSSYSPPIGVEPFVVLLSGPPGFGKSELLNVLSDKLITDIGYNTTGNVSYVRGFNKYWNNAGNQPNVIIDDVAINEETMKDFVTELFAMKSRTVFNPDFAHLEDKRRVFNPISIVMGSNFAFWDNVPTGVNCLAALHRRRNAVWEVQPNFPGAKSTEDQVEAMKKLIDKFSRDDSAPLTFDHLSFRLCVNPEVETARDAKWRPWMNFEKFYQTTLYLFKLHRQKEIKFVKNALDRAFKSRLAVISSSEDEKQASEILKDFQNRILTSPPKKALAELAIFNDPALTSTVGKVQLNEVDFDKVLKTALDKTKEVPSQVLEGQVDKGKKKKESPISKDTQLSKGVSTEDVPINPDIPTTSYNTTLIRFPIVNGPETVFTEIDFSPVIEEDKVWCKPVTEEEPEIEAIELKEVSQTCPHLKLKEWEVNKVMYYKHHSEKEGHFLFAPTFDVKDQIVYTHCKEKCYLQCDPGKQWHKDFLKKYESNKEQQTVAYTPPTRVHLCVDYIPDQTTSMTEILVRDRKTIIQRMEDFYKKFNWKLIAKVIGWISVSAGFLVLGKLAYNKLTKPKMEGNFYYMQSPEHQAYIRDSRHLNEHARLASVGAVFAQPDYEGGPDDAYQIFKDANLQHRISQGNGGSVMSSGGDSRVSSSSSRSGNTLRRMSTAYRRYEAQGGQFDQFVDIKSIIQSNLSRIVVERNGDTNSLGTNCLGLFGRCGFIMRHQISTLQTLVRKGDKIRTFIRRPLGKSYIDTEFDFMSIQFDPNDSSELVLYRFPRQMPSFKNIRTHIATEKCQVPKMCHMTWIDKKLTIQNKDIQVSRCGENQLLAAREPAPYKFMFSDSIAYNFGGPGLCGAPIISPITGKILAIHCAGYEDRQGSAQRIYQQQFSDMEGQHDLPEDAFCDDKPQINIPEGLEVLGILKKELTPGFSTKTQLVESLMYNEIFVSTKVPAPLKKVNGVDPMEKALQKLIATPTGFREDHLNLAKRSLIDDLIFECTPVVAPEDRTTLTMNQCLSGIPGFTEYKKLNLATSEGYPLCLNKDPHDKYHFGTDKIVSGKHWLFDYEIDNSGYNFKKIHPLLLSERQRMMTQRIAVTEGKDYGQRQFAVLTLKDQKMPIEKAILGKNRIFSACPVEQSIAVREYFGHFKAAYMHNRIDNSTAIGIDVTGTEWTRLALKLLSKGDNIVTGDYQAFGDTLDNDCMRIAFEAINEWYSFHFGDEISFFDNEMRTAIYHEVKQMPHIAKNVVFRRSNGIPSGFGLTVETNDLVNKLYMKLAWLALTGSSLREMKQHVYCCFYGDDMILSVSDTWKDLFNFKTIQSFLQRHNIIFTAATKDDSSYETLPLSKSTFLKANFVEHPQSNANRPIFMNVLPKESCLELLNWQWRDNDPKTFCFVASRAALQKLYFLGQEQFEKYRNKIIRFFAHNKGVLFGPEDIPDLQTFEELDTLFLEKFL